VTTNKVDSITVDDENINMDDPLIYIKKIYEESPSTNLIFIVFAFDILFIIISYLSYRWNILLLLIISISMTAIITLILVDSILQSPYSHRKEAYLISENKITKLEELENDTEVFELDNTMEITNIEYSDDTVRIKTKDENIRLDSLDKPTEIQDELYNL
jgi:hypothetical protein